MTQHLRLFLTCVCALCLSACALTSRSEPMRVRYFTLETGASEAQPTATHEAIELRLGRIEASNALREEIAFRDSQHELQFYDDQRWTEKPSDYLRRALSRTLYQERGLTRSFLGSAPTLDVELVEFEELRGPQPKVRLQAVAILHDERRSKFEETVTIERPVSATTPDHTQATAAALSIALRAAVAEVADRVIASLVSDQPAIGNLAPTRSNELHSQPAQAPATADAAH